MPDTPIGRRATGFLTAYNTGTDALATFIAAEMTPRDVSAPERARRLEGTRAQTGMLTVRQVLSASPTELTLVANGSNGGPVRMQFNADAAAPFRLLGVLFLPYP
ncbi:MAG: hypothetical protein MUE41_04280 [Gemmatimonadaceae bacterium]|nr:hypothetical protein [Gemmatimonadaceae bacterium]